MCRFLCYKGRGVLLAELLYKPKNSLIMQSYKAKEVKEPLNGDGFGVGWYAAEISETPCVFTSLTPAWSNRNLQNLADHVLSKCFFAHVRAASRGMMVSDVNCHPFSFGRYLWMHNGKVGGFHQIKRRLCQSLPDPVFLNLQGTTDSEHAFAVFLSLLENPHRLLSTEEMGSTLVRTLAQLEVFRAEAGVSETALCNFAVTDGQSMAAVRYVSDRDTIPNTLHYSSGRRYTCKDGVCRMVEASPEGHSVIIASERLTEFHEDWQTVPPNHYVTVSPQLEVQVHPVDFQAVARSQN